MPDAESLAERLWQQVDENGPVPELRPELGQCWVWTGQFNPTPSGMCYPRLGSVFGHRCAYELTVGPIPWGYHVDHLCRNTACVNPSHLEAVTATENIRRGYRDRKLLKQKAISSIPPEGECV